LQSAHEVSALPYFDVLAVERLLRHADRFLVIAAGKHFGRTRNPEAVRRFVDSIMVHDARCSRCFTGGSVAELSLARPDVATGDNYTWVVEHKTLS
jgi:hypothetical protein